ncbi:kinase-like domain-containing protein [Xylariaceae sp. FL0255]|nr:kinase-like domain-containing protein [Xylariaceae sp. FL0255]
MSIDRGSIESHGIEDVGQFFETMETRPQSDYWHLMVPEGLWSLVGSRGKHSGSGRDMSETTSNVIVLDYGVDADLRSRQHNQSSSDLEHGLQGMQQSNDAPPTLLTEQMLGESEYLKSNDSVLANTIKTAMRTSSDEDIRVFLPLRQLEKYCHEAAVRREFHLGIGDRELADKYTTYVCDDLKPRQQGGDPETSQQANNKSFKLFAILLKMKKLHLIEDFINAGIKDRHLPLRKEIPGDTRKEFKLIKQSTGGLPNPDPIACFDEWDYNDKNKFFKIQWNFMSPFFGLLPDGSAAIYNLDKQAIMPWLEADKVENDDDTNLVSTPRRVKGGNSDIQCVVIDPDQHSFDAKRFAIKTLFDSSPEDFMSEFNNLKMMNGKDHLLKVYGAYVKDKKYSFIFPWAEGGSLAGLWKKDPRSLTSKVSASVGHDSKAKRAIPVVRWIARQLAGLTGESGLKFLHETKISTSPLDNAASPDRLYGIHGDIKPGNILYFTGDGHDFGTLKISDFGFTQFHTIHSRSRVDPTGPHSPTYRSPQYGLEDKFLSRKYDIWGLGCVMLQFLTWFINGPEALENFDEKRFEETDEISNTKEDKFFRITRWEPWRAEKLSVQNQIEELENVVGQQNYLHDCLEFIRTRMLQIDDKQRADCEETHGVLKKWYERCQRDEEYATIELPDLYSQLRSSSARPPSEPHSPSEPQPPSEPLFPPEPLPPPEPVPPLEPLPPSEPRPPSETSSANPHFSSVNNDAGPALPPGDDYSQIPDRRGSWRRRFRFCFCKDRQH